MKRREFLKSLGVGVAGVLACRGGIAAAAEVAAHPNILFIFADDECYKTLHALNNPEVETPNLDRLVRRGVTFTHAYNQGGWHGAICVASRTMLNTGRFLWNAAALDNAPAMEQERVAGRLWSEYLRGAGYRTYMTGKWHIKADAEKAFDVVTHVRPGMPNQTPEGYNRPIEGKPDVWQAWDTSRGGYWQGGKHWSEVLGDDAVGYLQQAAKDDKPFFMYLAFNAPHDPRQSPKEFVDKYPLDKIGVPKSFMPEYPWKDKMGCGKGLRDERLAPFPRTEYAVKVNRQEYYAIITHMDQQVGRILKALEETGKADNTYIFFTADHGLAVGHHGLIGKQNMFDHSMRVPLIVNGPGIPADRKLDTRVYLQDIMATTLELAGLPPQKAVQFKSLMPLIQGKRKENYDAVYGAYMKLQRMVTEGDDKLILYPEYPKALLFNVAHDPEEMNDLSDKPESRAIMKRLFAKLLELQRDTGDKLNLAAAFPELAR